MEKRLKIKKLAKLSKTKGQEAIEKIKILFSNTTLILISEKPIKQILKNQKLNFYIIE
jgi:hypothetical protein